MTIMDGAATGSSNVFSTDELSELDSSKLASHSSTQFELTNSDFSVTAVGSGFTYSGNHPTDGTITGFTIQEGSAATVFSDSSVSAATLWHDISSGDVTDFENLLFGGNDTFNSGAVSGNSDNLNGYGGDDIFNYAGNFIAACTINGGTGNDTLNLDGDYSGSKALQFLPDTIQSVENIVLAAGHSYSIITANGNVAAGTVLNVNASALGAADILNFDGSAEQHGSFNVTGGAGDDVFRGGAGNDTFNGGAGDDVVSYASSSTDLTINIGTSGPQTIGQGFGTDTLISVEGVITGSGNDVITGDSNDNFIDAGAGNNTIDGGAGNDTVSFADTAGPISIDLSLNHQKVNHNDGVDTITSVENVIGTDQNDTIIAGNNDNVIDGGFGGDLNDTLYYTKATAGVTIDFSAGTGIGNVTGGSGHDTISDIGHIIGSSFDDTLIVGLDPQNLSGGVLPQSFDGGGGDDTVDFSHLASGVNMTILGAGPTLTNVDNIIGTSFADTLAAPYVGGGGVAVLDGGDGNDLLYNSSPAGGVSLNGGAGDDTLQFDGFSAADSADGGTGNDVLYYSNNGGGFVTFGPTTMVNVETLLLERALGAAIKTDDANVAAGATLTVEFSSDNSDIPAQSVRFDGSAETDGKFNVTTLDGDDWITGGAGNDTISTGTGNDKIDISFGGNDVVLAGPGDDIVIAGAALTAADRIDGGGGNDMLTLNGDYSAGLVFGAATMINIATLQLAAGHSYALTTNDANVAAGATLTVDASNLGAGDVLTFDGSHETDGGFSLIGGAGNDVLAGGAGNDTFEGGTGINTVDYSRATGGVTVSLALNGAQNVGGGEGTDTLSDIENLIGSAFADTLVAASTTVSLSGGKGDDVLNFGATLSATQVANGGVGNDTLVLNGDYSAGFVFGAGTVVSIETLRLTGGHSYNLTMNDANVLAGQTLNVDASGLGAGDALNFDGSHETDGGFSIKGGHGNDVLAGGAGSDTLNGGAGSNTASYANAASAVTVSLAVSGAQNTGGSGTDTLIAIENLTGSSYDDALAGSSVSNVLDGGSGNDTLDLSAGGNDTALGGDGDDTIVFGAAFTANDKIDGGSGNDTVTLDGDYSKGVTFKSTTMVNVETISLAAGHSYSLATVDATVAAGATLTVDGSGLGAGDTLTFNGDREKDGSFVLKGGAGADVLIGGAGNDVITGGLGADHLTGGAGSDHFLYNSVAESTGAGFDTITKFDATADAFDLPGTVSGLNHTVKGGALSAASFDSDLASAIGAGQLAAGHAVLFVPLSGTYAGDEFLIVDANGVAGYQAGQDFVFLLDRPEHFSSMGAANFI